MNIHLPAILMFTRGTRVLTHPQLPKCVIATAMVFSDPQPTMVHSGSHQQPEEVMAADEENEECVGDEEDAEGWEASGGKKGGDDAPPKWYPLVI